MPGIFSSVVPSCASATQLTSMAEVRVSHEGVKIVAMPQSHQEGERKAAVIMHGLGRASAYAISHEDIGMSTIDVQIHTEHSKCGERRSYGAAYNNVDAVARHSYGMDSPWSFGKHLSGAVSRGRLQPRSGWTNQGMGRVKSE